MEEPLLKNPTPKALAVYKEGIFMIIVFSLAFVMLTYLVPPPVDRVNFSSLSIKNITFIEYRYSSWFKADTSPPQLWNTNVIFHQINDTAQLPNMSVYYYRHIFQRCFQQLVDQIQYVRPRDTYQCYYCVMSICDSKEPVDRQFCIYFK